MTLSISPTRSGLTTTIVCKGCEHVYVDPGPECEWADTNGDTYFQGASRLALDTFLAIHPE